MIKGVLSRHPSEQGAGQAYLDHEAFSLQLTEGMLFKRDRSWLQWPIKGYAYLCGSWAPQLRPTGPAIALIEGAFQGRQWVRMKRPKFDLAEVGLLDTSPDDEAGAATTAT